MPSRALALAVALTSAGALAYEILLIRLFAIVEWHHLAFLVISLALLGYGASGTVLALARERLLRRFELATATAAAGFGATSIGAFLIAQRIDLNSLEIFWSTRELGLLFVLYLLFAVPFFCAAIAIGLALTRFGAEAPWLYRADLVGGGVSAAAVTALLFVVHPVTALQIVSALGFVAAALFHRRSAWIAYVLMVIAVRPLAVPLRISEFKELSHALRVPEARVVEERSSPFALLTAVDSLAVPFRHAPGLSLAFAGDIPRQIGVFSDGGGMTPIVRGESTEYLEHLPTAVAYRVGIAKERVAVIGAGGGTEVLSALRHGAREVVAVELNPQMVDVVRRWSDVYEDRRVRVVTAEGRRFVRESRERYDVIQLAMVGTHGASTGGMQAVSESYLYTVEAMREMIARLRPGGLLVVTRWMQTPPREVVKLFATAVEALGEERARRRVALIRGWNTATLIVRNGDFTAGEIAALRRFCDERSFDLEYAPGVRREETNQLNVLDEPYLFDAATALLAGKREDLFDRYKFNIRPATDERPYFFHSFRWRALPELLRLRARGGMPLLEWGYLVLVIALVQAVIAAAVLILLPLLLVRGAAPKRVVYFGAIGLGFLFIEIAFMQRLTLFLGHPLAAIALVLASFLVFGGLGSGFAARIGDRLAARVPLIVAVIAIVALVIARTLTATALGLPDAAKIAISIVLIAPLAFAMGMPFPLGLRGLAARDPGAIPWAWGINGTASVLSSMIATLVLVHFGFSALVVLAALLYAIASYL